MSVIAFDTHAFVKELTHAGMPEEQAEVLAEFQSRLINERLATKQGLKELETKLTGDIKELETKLTRDIKELEINLNRNIKELESRLTIRLGSMMFIAVGTVAALVKIL